MPEPHPAIITYGNTVDHSFPLILIFGREPNSSNDGVHGVGPYDFMTKEGRRCAFWNTSYSLVARSIGKKTHEFKKLCVEMKCSPIIYSDVLPITIPNSVKNKSAIRKQIPGKNIQDHIDHIFSQRELIDRVDIVISSGVSGPDFQKSRAFVTNMCKSHNKICFDVPFFDPRNTTKILSSVEGECFRRIGLVARKFKTLKRVVWDDDDFEVEVSRMV